MSKVTFIVNARNTEAMLAVNAVLLCWKRNGTESGMVTLPPKQFKAFMSKDVEILEVEK